MSSNRISTNKMDPRIARREAMVTRHKSAQMRRQLRTKDRSMKHLTNLLKSPTKDSQPTKTVPVKKKQSPKAKQSLLKSAERVQNLPKKTFKLSKVIRKEVILIPDEEYYPDKLKRKLAINKVVLKPKNALRVVGEIAGSPKRKCALPLKASEKPSPERRDASPVCTKQSMAEAISMMEDQLTDEDLMEILTCPSPVWWEDPPDEEYIEDAIFTRTEQPQPTAEPMEVDTDKTENDSNDIIVIPNLSSKSDKFLKKRSKLEDLLGNIKDKNKCAAKQSIKDVFNEDVVVLCSNYRANTDEFKVNENESDDEIMFHNSMNEDELLKGLENMDIPIANRRRSSDVIIIDDDDDSHTPTSNEAIKETIKENHESVSDNSIEVVIDNAKNTDEAKIPKDTVSNCNVGESPKKSDSLSSKPVVFVQDADVISDTNVKILEHHDERILDSTDMAGTSNENTMNNNECKQSSEENVDTSTVYLIDEMNEDTSNSDPELKRTVEAKLETGYENISKDKTKTNGKAIQAKVNHYYEEIKETNTEDMQCIVATKTSDYKRMKIENSNDLNNLIEAKLSDCYKKCKRAQKRTKHEKSDINKNDVIQNAEEIDNFPTMFCDPCKPSFKRVSEDENVKYCLNCSSIFDTNECTYCTKKFKNKIYICIPCKIKFCCDNFYKTHEKQGCSYNTVSRKVVFTQLSDKGISDGSPNVQVINYSVCADTVDVAS